MPVEANAPFPNSWAAVPGDSLLQRANRELSARLLTGIYAYGAMLAILRFSTGAFQDHPRLVWTTAALILCGTFFRTVLIVKGRLAHTLETLRWRILVGISIAVISGAAGYLHAGLLAAYQFDSWTFTVSVICMVGLSAGGSVVFVPYMGFVWMHVFLMEIPVAMVSFWLGGNRGITFALTVALFVAFLISHARRLHTLYWQGLIDRAHDTERQHELELLSNAKSQFLANMSHEIRTPLHGILGMAQLLQDPGSSSEQRESYLEALHGSAKGLLSVLNDVLDFSKIEAGKVRLENAAMDMREIIEEIQQIFMAQATSKGIRLDCTVAAEVPPTVLGDQVRLRQILMNLIANAIKFTEKGRVSAGVSLGKQAGNSLELHFMVEDTGIGIPKEKQKSIFDAFTQADASVSRRFGGTGLGLAISSQLVQLMGGNIEVKSTSGVGSKFSFSARFGRCTEPVPAAGAAEPVFVSRLRILLAEDNLINQVVSVRLLQKQGHSVKVVANGRQAIEAVATGNSILF